MLEKRHIINARKKSYKEETEEAADGDAEGNGAGKSDFGIATLFSHGGDHTNSREASDIVS